MSPEQRLALYAGGLAALGVLLVITAVFAAGREHKEDQ